MNNKIMAACRAAIKSYKGPGGSSYAGVVADSGGHFKSEGTLRNLVSPACEQNPLRFDDALEIFEITRATAIPQAVADQFGGVFVPRTETGELEPECLLSLGIKLNRKSANYTVSLDDAMADGHLDRSEATDLVEQIEQLEQKMAEKKQHVKQAAGL